MFIMKKIQGILFSFLIYRWPAIIEVDQDYKEYYDFDETNFRVSELLL